MLKNQKIVVFDFDGTLSASDSNKEFIKYCFAHSLRPWLFLPMITSGAALSLFDRKDTDLRSRPIAKLWREIMRSFVSEKLVQRLAQDFIKQHRMRRFDWAAKCVAEEGRTKDVKVILISAGPDYLIPHLVKDMKFDVVLCSQMHKRLPWKFNFLCWGSGKVAALEKWAKNNNVNPVVLKSYGDSYGDMPLMEMAKEQIWIDSKTGNRRV